MKGHIPSNFDPDIALDHHRIDYREVELPKNLGRASVVCEGGTNRELDAERVEMGAPALR